MHVSSPFFSPSVHDAARAQRLLPSVHTSLAQSLLALHLSRAAHLPHVAPPQSTSVSSPLSTKSEHVAATHTAPTSLLAHTPDAQSDPEEHSDWGGHGAQSCWGPHHRCQHKTGYSPGDDCTIATQRRRTPT